MTTVSGTTPWVDNVGRAESRWLRVSWGPIMMGVIIAIGLQFIFTVLGIAIGATATDSASTGVGEVQTVGIAAGVWWLVTGTLSLAVGGFVFGRMAGVPRSTPLKLEAAVLWGVVALFGFFIVWSGAGMLAQATSPIGAISMTSVRSNAGTSFRLNDTGQTDRNELQSNNPPATMEIAEKARRATRTAAWWSIVGLVAGLMATIGGACAGVPRDLWTRSA